MKERNGRLRQTRWNGGKRGEVPERKEGMEEGKVRKWLDESIGEEGRKEREKLRNYLKLERHITLFNI